MRRVFIGLLIFYSGFKLFATVQISTLSPYFNCVKKMQKGSTTHFLQFVFYSSCSGFKRQLTIPNKYLIVVIMTLMYMVYSYNTWFSNSLIGLISLTIALVGTVSNFRLNGLLYNWGVFPNFNL